MKNLRFCCVFLRMFGAAADRESVFAESLLSGHVELIAVSDYDAQGRFSDS